MWYKGELNPHYKFCLIYFMKIVAWGNEIQNYKQHCQVTHSKAQIWDFVQDLCDPKDFFIFTMPSSFPGDSPLM
jgi:hypothetical protein